MKVIAFNGSPHANGNTYQSLEYVAAPLREQGIEVEIVQVGNKHIRGCVACNQCSKLKNERCALDDDFNTLFQKAKEADGLLIGSPVHYSSIGGTMKCFLDRLFYVNGANGNMFRRKAGAAVAAVRRTGGSSTFDALNHYLTYAEMVIPTGDYWSVAHGTVPGDVEQDAEAVHTLTVLGENMAWLMKVIEAGRDQVAEPEKRRKIMTNFIR